MLKTAHRSQSGGKREASARRRLYPVLLPNSVCTLALLLALASVIERMPPVRGRNDATERGGLARCLLLQLAKSGRTFFIARSGVVTMQAAAGLLLAKRM